MRCVATEGKHQLKWRDPEKKTDGNMVLPKQDRCFFPLRPTDSSQTNVFVNQNYLLVKAQ